MKQLNGSMANIIHPVCIYTIGHSNHGAGEFVSLLRAYEIRRLVDIRRFPSSRKFPHFNQVPLRELLAAEGIEYLWAEALGGRRHSVNPDSPNRGLKSAGFRNYADYMLTEPFKNAAGHLMTLAAEATTAVMCAEKLFWKCHRRILSDYLVARNVQVIHILDPEHSQRHTLSPGAVITATKEIFYLPELDNKTLFDS